MLFLLPPSETKRSGGGSLNIGQVALTFGGLNPARDAVFAALEKLCRQPSMAAKVLKLTPKQLGAIPLNLGVQTAPTMRALERYTGTLYGAIDAEALGAAAWTRAKETVLIQSALFGLIPATDLIPEYRLSGSTSLAVKPVGKPRAKAQTLREVWSSAHEQIFERVAPQAPMIDLRSKVYANLAPIPTHIPHHWVEVVSRESNGELKALNHFNKLAKGRLIGAVLRAKSAPSSVADLAKIAEGLGMELYLGNPTEPNGKLILVTDQVVGK